MRFNLLVLSVLTACPVDLPPPVVSEAGMIPTRDATLNTDTGRPQDGGAISIDGGTMDVGMDTTPPIDGGNLPDAGSDAGVVDVGFERGTPEYYGERLYRYYCGFCHGYQGEGYRSDNANALSNPNFLRSATREFWDEAIIYGRPGTPMSAWGREMGGPLRAIDVDDIMAYVAYWDHPEPIEGLHEQVVTGDRDRGWDLYLQMGCDDCHGEDGSGITAPGVSNPWLLESASDGFLRYAIAEGRPGTDMPGYENILSDQEIDDLVVLLRSWATPVNREPPEPFEPDLSEPLINPDGEAASFAPREGTFYVPAQQVYDQLVSGRRMILADARATSDYLVGHISGAVSLPFYDEIVQEAIEVLPRDTWIIAYCGCPHAVSGRLAQALIDGGFEYVGVLDEGYYYWRDERWPITNGRERY